MRCVGRTAGHSFLFTLCVRALFFSAWRCACCSKALCSLQLGFVLVAARPCALCSQALCLVQQGFLLVAVRCRCRDKDAPPWCGGGVVGCEVGWGGAGLGGGGWGWVGWGGQGHRTSGEHGEKLEPHTPPAHAQRGARFGSKKDRGSAAGKLDAPEADVGGQQL